MAKLVLTDPVFTLGGVPYSDEVRSMTIDASRDEHDVTNFASAGDREFIVGHRQYQISVDFVQDADLSGIDAAIWTEFTTNNPTGLAWTGKQDDGAISTSNPEYSGTLHVTEWSPIVGSVAEPFGQSRTWRGTGAIVRDTVP